MKKSQRGEADFTIPYVVVRSMLLECNDLYKKSNNDVELQKINKYLNQIDSDVRSFLDSLLEIKNANTFQKIKKTIYSFIDISSELMDLQLKVKLNLNRGNSFIRTDSHKYMGTEKNQTLLMKDSKPMNKKFQLKLMNLKKSIHKAEQSPNQSKKVTKRISQKKCDMRALRNSMLSDLRYEMSRNPYINDTDLEISDNSAFLEKTIFAKTFDGGYEIKMRKLIRLFSVVQDMKKLTSLIILKNYDLNILLFLMEKPFQILNEYEKHKDKLLLDMGFGNLLRQSQIQGKKSKQICHLEKIQNSLKQKMLEKREEYFKSSNTYSGISIKRKPSKTELNQKADQIVASLRNTINNINYPRNQQMMNDSFMRGTDNIKIRKKREFQKRLQEQKEHYKEQLLKPTNLGREDPVGWSVYRGEILAETEVLQTQFEFVVLNSLEPQDKLKKIPQLPEILSLKGVVSHSEFVKYIGKLLRKIQISVNFFFGFLESDSEATKQLSYVLNNKKKALFSKYSPRSKVLIFPKTVLLENWAKILKFNPHKISLLKSEIFWLIIHNHQNENIPYETVNPIPIYTLNYKKEAFKNNITLTPVSSEDEGSKREVLKKVESQPKTGVQRGVINPSQMYPIKNNILLNVLKLGNKQQEQANYYHQQRIPLLNQKQKSYDSGYQQKLERNQNTHYQQTFKQNQGRRDKKIQNVQQMDPLLEDSKLGKRSYPQVIEQTARKSAIESFLGSRKTIKKQKKPFHYRPSMERERPQNTPFPIEDDGSSNEITNMKEFYNKGHQIGSQLKSNYYDLSGEDSHTWKMNRQGNTMDRQMSYMNPLGKKKKGDITKLYKKL